MPKFSQQELEEIKRNTERIEQERQRKEAEFLAEKNKKSGHVENSTHVSYGSGKKSSETKSKQKSRKVGSKKRKKDEYSVMERMIAVILLLVTILISYIVMAMS